MKSTLLLIAALSLTTGCGSDKTTEPPPGKVWTALDPTQCLGSPWARAWLDANSNNDSGYPGLNRPGSGETAVIREFLDGRGIDSFSIVYEFHASGETCLACSCSAGYTVFVEVGDEDRTAMENLGFRIESPES